MSMIKLNKEIPSKVLMATSGGVDSMAALDFVRRSRKVVVAHYNHGTGEFADNCTELVREYCARHNIQYVEGTLAEELPSGRSLEDWWREQRYNFFAECSMRHGAKVITAHHLDDVVENWIFTSMNGNPFLIPDERNFIVRPFLTTRKRDFYNWCERKSVPFLEDPTNENLRFRRNFIRHVMVPHALEVNPGIHKVLKKKIMGR